MSRSITLFVVNVMFHAILFCSLNLPHFGLSLTKATSILGGNDTDHLALLAMKAEIKQDPLQVLRSWNTSVHFCQWHGVTCSRQHGRVTILDLQDQQLAGSLSPHVGNLSFLKTLRLGDNNFSHEIPQELGQLFRLQELSLENNSLQGEIPRTISACSRLTFLGLSHNMLVGNIPTALASLSKLEVILLHSNNLTGKIPHFFGNFSYVKTISAWTNNLEGSIPNTLGQLTSLQSLQLYYNKLSGVMPSSIYNISSLVVLNVKYNNIQGTLPPYLGLTLPHLQEFNIAFNSFTGSIPASISNASNLVRLFLRKNHFTGKIPDMAGLKNLQQLTVYANNLGDGQDDDLGFFSSLANCSHLDFVDVSDNNLGGELPKSIGNFSRTITRINVGKNHIGGSIPIGLGDLFNLYALQFNENKLVGTIPSSLGNLTSLSTLNLANNNLEGGIPASLRNCKKLQMLDLSQNQLTGYIPPEVIGLESLSKGVNLSRNHLIGTLPSVVGNAKNLESLVVSHNNLSGEIPSSLAGCSKLEMLDLADNHFQGKIPMSLRSLRGISYLDISHNYLSGQFPDFLENFLFLGYLNLSFNNLEGEVPTEGVFKNVSVVSVFGNSRLCGGKLEFRLPACTVKNSKGTIFSEKKWLIPVFAGLIILILSFSLWILCWFRKTKQDPSSISSFDSSFLDVSYQNLLNATDGFSPANLVGSGGFSSVYKGTLDQDGTLVAVKVLNLQTREASKSFVAECEVLKNIRHRNLVKVLTACSSIDFQGDAFRALVYEFMVNGSLEEWLNPVFRVVGGHFEPRILSLLQRINIATDVASAIDYLHHACQTPIVHCDLKPSNVLLDGDMTAHVGDFGLARFLPETTHASSSNQSTSLGIKGSIGYAAPEYGMGERVSTSGDVYSYGIILLAMFTGKRPTDEMFTNGLNLHNFAKMALPERVMEIIDPILLRIVDDKVTIDRIYSEGSVGIIQECLISVLRIGVTCSTELPRQRMNMTDVSRELHLVKDTLLRAGIY